MCVAEESCFRSAVALLVQEDQIMEENTLLALREGAGRHLESFGTNPSSGSLHSSCRL